MLTFILFVCTRWFLLADILSYAVTAEPCQACKDVVTSFKNGIDRTARYNFGGGDTDWEEKKLGSYGNSETRLVEIMEDICKSGVDKKDECHTLAEAHEDKIEDWWFHKQKAYPDLVSWLCINEIKVCCPKNTFGPNCDPCLGVVENPCFNNGDCDGEGTRQGTGKCKCYSKYEGELCDICAFGYEEIFKNESHISCTDVNECNPEKSPCETGQYCENIPGTFTCHECDNACVGCTDAGPSNCIECKEGFSLRNGQCTDINSTEAENILNEETINSNIDDIPIAEKSTNEETINSDIDDIPITEKSSNEETINSHIFDIPQNIKSEDLHEDL